MDFDTPRLLELLRNPAEDLSFEIKEWLDLRDNVHKAKLAQAIIALANHGGGALLLGYATCFQSSVCAADISSQSWRGEVARKVKVVYRLDGFTSGALVHPRRTPRLGSEQRVLRPGRRGGHSGRH